MAPTGDRLTSPRNFSPWSQWMTRLATVHPADPLPSAGAEIGAWLPRVRARLDGLLGDFPSRVPLNLETTHRTSCDGYHRERIVFDTEDTMSVPAYLLVPDDRVEAGPAVLAIHGHGPGKSQVCGVEAPEASDDHDDDDDDDDDDADEPAAPNSDYAHQLARRGYLVLAPDLRCFGERADWNPPDHYACDTNLVHAVMAGVSPLTQNLWDLARCLDVLVAHPLVDADRIGMVGLSYGGTVTLFLAALDDRVAAAVVSGYFSSWAESHKMPWNMCGSQVLPGMLGRIEHVDLGALIAPRPLLVETGTEDLLFPVATAVESVGRLRAVYARLDAADRLEHDVFAGDHQWHGARAHPFLDRWLVHSPA